MSRLRHEIQQQNHTTITQCISTLRLEQSSVGSTIISNVPMKLNQYSERLPETFRNYEAKPNASQDLLIECERKESGQDVSEYLSPNDFDKTLSVSKLQEDVVYFSWGKQRFDCMFGTVLTKSIVKHYETRDLDYETSTD